MSHINTFNSIVYGAAYPKLRHDPIYSPDFSGYAILAVGSVKGKEGIEAHTLTANNIYTHLIHQGFALTDDENEKWNDPLDHIRYYNPYEDPQTGEDNYTADGSYSQTLRNTITQWAPEKMRELPGPLFIILINHGSPDTFYLTGEQPLTAQELGKWLDIFQDQMKTEGTDRPVVVVLGACYSGSFTDDLSAPGRIIVTNSAGDEPSYRGPANPHSGVRDGEFFTGALFRQLAARDSLRESFEQAVSQTESHTHSGKNERPAPYRDTAKQHPLLDDNGDGQGLNNLNAGDDGDVAEGIFLGPANAGANPLTVTSAGMDPKTPPALDFSESQAVLWAEVSDADRAEAVWVEIREPGMILVGGETQQTIDLTSLALERDGSADRYMTTYAGFSAPGKYTLFFYAKNRQGIISPFRRAFLYKGLPAARGDATGDEATDLADVILMLRVLCNKDTGGGGISLAGDFSGDGKIGNEDVLAILRQLGGM